MELDFEHILADVDQRMTEIEEIAKKENINNKQPIDWHLRAWMIANSKVKYEMLPIVEPDDFEVRRKKGLRFSRDSQSLSQMDGTEEFMSSVARMKFPGVYAFWWRRQCLYVGSSQDLSLRVIGSMWERRIRVCYKDAELTFARFQTTADARDIERILIWEHKPKLNAESTIRSPKIQISAKHVWSDRIRCFSKDAKSRDRYCLVCNGELMSGSQVRLNVANPVWASRYEGFCQDCAKQQLADLRLQITQRIA